MPPIIPPLLAALTLFALATLVGLAPIVKLIKVHEAHHELKQGSAGLIRTLTGWSVIAFWVMSSWFLATIIGDWGATEDLSGAVDRSWVRLRILLEIASALADSD